MINYKQFSNIMKRKKYYEIEPSNELEEKRFSLEENVSKYKSGALNEAGLWNAIKKFGTDIAKDVKNAFSTDDTELTADDLEKEDFQKIDVIAFKKLKYKDQIGFSSEENEDIDYFMVCLGVLWGGNGALFFIPETPASREDRTANNYLIIQNTQGVMKKKTKINAELIDVKNKKVIDEVITIQNTLYFKRG